MYLIKLLVLSFLLIMFCPLLAAENPAPEDLILKKEITISAPPAEVWKAWTTPEGVAAFFAPKSNIDLKKLGDYQIFFIPEAPEGERGCDDCRVLSYVPEKMLSFEWSVPPKFPDLRKKYPNMQMVVLFLEPKDNKKTKVTLHHLGFGKEKEWYEVYEYFDKAWDFVLKGLEKSFNVQSIQ